MKKDSDLRLNLQRIDGKGYKAYKDIKGRYNFKNYELIIDHVQGDPFALPSRVRIVMSMAESGFGPNLYSNKSRKTAFCDFITRSFHLTAKRITVKNRGSGKSGLITIDHPGQEILERTSVLVNNSHLEVRFVMGFPAFGRRIAGKHAEEMFFEELPKIVCESLYLSALDESKLNRHIETSEDADAIRRQLSDIHCIAFIADGAILPRKTGIDPRPLENGDVIPFKSPKSYLVELSVPNAGIIKGMGIPTGITLIVGGGYHGKSTLLSAVEMGIYNHIPGDGREFVISHPDAVKIRAEDGRRVEKVWITPFISNLPFQRDTTAFSTDDASGSTSQAANIMEALEIGAACLLIDEDTSATNFMIRDQRMQMLVSKDNEPITPFIDRIRQLKDEFRVSTILVIGGCGDYFDVADNVICMNCYLPEDVINQTTEIVNKYPTDRIKEVSGKFGSVIHRIPDNKSIDPSRDRHAVKISEKGVNGIVFGKHMIDLGSIEQLVSSSQTRAIGDAINLCKKYINTEQSLKDVLEMLLTEINKNGLSVLNSNPMGNYAQFRKYELAAAINRLRTLKMDQKK